MTEKLKYILVVIIGSIVSYIIGKISGIYKQKEKQQKEVFKNVKKSNSIDNTPYSDIDRMQDKYE